MNNKRRARLKEILNMLNECREKITDVYDEEVEALDNLPESFEGTDRYELIENNVDLFESAIDFLDDVIGYMSDIQ